MIFISKIKEIFVSEQDNWFLWIPVLFGLGIGAFFLLPTDYSIYWTLGVIELLIILAILFRFQPKVLLLLLVIGIFVLGFANIQLKTVYLAKNKTIVTQEQTYVRGEVDSLSYNSRGKPRITLKAYNWDDKYLGNLRISLRSNNEVIQVGKCVELVAKIMPLPKASIVGGFQFDRKSFFEGIDGTGFAESRALDIDCDNANAKASYISNIRSKIIAKIYKILPTNQAGIVSALVAGEKGKINSKIVQNYRDSGLAHFLSISGLHMSMIAGLMFFFTRLIIAFIPSLALRFDSKKTSAVFAIIISSIYLLISGAEIPTQRAFIMTFIVLLGVLFDRRAISMQTIAWAALIILIIAPQALVGASFQMSFAAVIGLVAFYEKFASSIKRFVFDGNIKWLNIMLAYVIGILISDLIASISTLPFAIYHFNKIALYTTLANLMAGPIIGLLIMPFILVSILLMPIGLDAWSLKIVGYGVEVINNITSYVSSLPHAGYKVVSMPFWGLFLIVIGGLWLCLWKQKWRLYGLIAITLGLLSIFIIKTPDVIINDDASLIALKDNNARLIILPSKGNNFDKKMWLEKTANNKLSTKDNKRLKQIFNGTVEDKDWIDLSCDEEKCIYKNLQIYKNSDVFLNDKKLDMPQMLGASIYLPKNIISIRDYIGNRAWNM